MLLLQVREQINDILLYMTTELKLAIIFFNMNTYLISLTSSHRGFSGTIKYSKKKKNCLLRNIYSEENMFFFSLGR